MRNGKIAKLPCNIREELNLRMENNEDGAAILDWLNGVPAVQESLKAGFNGTPISKQNLCEWRQGGFREWQMREELIEEASELSSSAREMGEVVDAPLLAGDLTVMLAARYAALLNSWDGEADAKIDEKLRVLRGLVHDLALIQKTIDRANKQEIEFNQHLEDEHQRTMEKAKEKTLAPFWSIFRQRTLAEMFGGGESGKKIADFITAVENDLPLPKFDDSNGSGQTQSNPVKPNQRESNLSTDPPPVSVDSTG